MGYVWQDWALEALSGIEPHEVVQVLNAERRSPRLATSPGGVEVLTIWARTRAGRPLIVAIRRTGEWDWLIIGARDMNPAEAEQFAQWEADDDE